MSCNVFVATPERRENLSYISRLQVRRHRSASAHEPEPRAVPRGLPTPPAHPLIPSPDHATRTLRPPSLSPGQAVLCFSSLLPAHGSDPVVPTSRVAILRRPSVQPQRLWRPKTPHNHSPSACTALSGDGDVKAPELSPYLCSHASCRCHHPNIGNR